MRPSPSIPMSGPLLKTEQARWAMLTMVWAIYYLAIYSIGSIGFYAQRVIWGGALLVGSVTLPVFATSRNRLGFPAEGVLLLLFSAWAAAGFFMAEDQALFMLYLRQIVELALIVIFVSAILKRSGGAKWFYWAFLGVSAYSLYFMDDMISVDQLQLKTRIASANTLGFNCYLGLLSMLALFGETTKTWIRGVLAGAGLLALFGVVLSASRGAFMATVLLVLLWVPLCLIGSGRYKFAAVLAATVIFYAAYGVFQFVIHETYMGTRFTQATQLEDNSSQTRLELVGMGWRLFSANPIMGCGVGQFGIASGRGLNAHNEAVEIAATTGLPGFILYYAVFVVAWKRLSRSLRFRPDPKIRYRINIARIALLTLLVSGAMTRPNFLSQNTMFMMGVAIGVAHWAEQQVRWGHGRSPAPSAIPFLAAGAGAALHVPSLAMGFPGPDPVAPWGPNRNDSPPVGP